jgi:BirA family biotin operon repressor/biotin-[acetyl-CoA-carboxylase] ligase
MEIDRKTAVYSDIFTDRLQTLEIHNVLHTNFVARIIYLFASLESTNKTAFKMADRPTPEGVPEGTLVLADTQTKGRGRMGRHWISPPAVNIYASIILRPTIPVLDAPVITCLAANSAVQAIRTCTQLEAAIKWPNDILMGEKKVGGILTELSVVQNQVNCLVIGFGINVNLDPQVLPPQVRLTATSLKTESRENVNRNKLVGELCNHFEERYLRLLKEGTTLILKEFRLLTTTLGKTVKVITSSGTLEGNAEDVDPHGALILRTGSATHTVVRSGDVVHLRNHP